MSSLAPQMQQLLNDPRTRSDIGSIPAPVPGVHFFWSRTVIPRVPLVYAAGIVIVGQGYKVGYLGERKFRYDAETFLLLGMPIPFECETHGTPEEPLLGIRIDIDVARLHELVAGLGWQVNLEGADGALDAHSAVEPSPMGAGMLQATSRLLTCMGDPLDSRVLGPGAVNEVVYRVLRSEQGKVLFTLTQHHTPYAAVARSLDRIHMGYRETLTVEQLAKESAMSLSSFHRVFKKVTGETPLQYLKKIRLDKAMGLLRYDRALVNDAAFGVGYESPSQFSRDFKRHFKMAPSAARAMGQPVASAARRSTWGPASGPTYHP